MTQVGDGLQAVRLVQRNSTSTWIMRRGKSIPSRIAYHVAPNEAKNKKAEPWRLRSESRLSENHSVYVYYVGSPSIMEYVGKAGRIEKWLHCRFI